MSCSLIEHRRIREVMRLQRIAGWLVDELGEAAGHEHMAVVHVVRWPDSMRIRHAVTGETVPFRADFIVEGEEEWRVTEAMSSGLVDLTVPTMNLAERIHPTKAMALEWIVTGECQSVVRSGSFEPGSGFEPGKVVRLARNVEIMVNGAEGALVVRSFAECLDGHRQLLSGGRAGGVLETIALDGLGFDAQAEPVVRRMIDGTLILIFAALPPFVAEANDPQQKPFDLDAFAAELSAAIGPGVSWEDRDVFVLQRPDGDTLPRLRRFLGGYWKKRAKPWWKVW